MSSPMPPYAFGTAHPRYPSRRRSPQLSTGFLPSRSYIAARGAIFSRVSASARSTTACRILARHGRRRGRALAGGLLAAARAGLVQLDQVAVRVVHEQLLELGADDGHDAPVLDAHAVELALGLLDVGNSQRHVERRRVLLRPFGVARRAFAAHDVDLRVVAAVHPAARNT